ncbi:M16 family metallopeptidase [Seleniivibrio woodruffii]|uniref:Putative Zn-dependent peptidase n=1 Tax=Seleniivibrio woodruffii TaxID=1078050 RepID=A0A4R1KD93_9BACT|nr:pitrilysin family protein [Seleniivibrio woodruffii]TCK62504.1 putative Zn-dependent peptidase [Seleniivibrio woodruffii]TVZ37069.1 putative Zn-dependent peptidase [Seleniivibrio woodruffii]
MAKEMTKLDNNVTLIYKYIPGIKVVSVQTWMKTGSVNETEKESGISHFLEHMVFKGTRKYAPSEIDTIVEGKGGVMNAATSKDYTYYYINIPSYNAEVAFDTISEMVFRASFIPEEIEKEKPVVVQEIKMGKDRPTSEMMTTFFREMFKGSPYEREIIGTEDTVNSFTREMLVDYYNRYYHPDNMTLVVVGDIAYDEVLKLAKQYYSDKRSVPVGKRYEDDRLNSFDKPVDIVVKKDINQEYGVVAFPALSILQIDVFAMEILGEIISGGEFSVLNRKFRHENDLANSITGGYYGMKHAGTFLFSYNCQAGKGDAVRDEILKLTSEIEKYLTDENIEKAKNRLLSQMMFQREKASSEANDIGYSYTVEQPEYYDNFVESIRKTDKLEIMTSIKTIFSSQYVRVRTQPMEKK